LTRWGPPLESELPALAAQLGVVAYDLRLRLAGGLPAVFATVSDEAEANQHLEFLRARGHGAVLCNSSVVRSPEEQLVPSLFELTATSVSGSLGGNQKFDVPYTDIFALVHAASVISAEETKTTQEKKLSLGRAVVSGGLVMRKKVDRVDKKVTTEQEQVLYMFSRAQPTPYLWKELTLNYEGLGEERKLTTVENFATLTKQLRARAPHAFYDQRLLTQKRRGGITSLAGGAKDRRIETSNVRENDLAVFLLLRAHFEDQL